MLDAVERVAGGQGFLLYDCDTVHVRFSAGKVARVQDSSVEKFFEGVRIWEDFGFSIWILDWRSHLSAGPLDCTVMVVPNVAFRSAKERVA